MTGAERWHELAACAGSEDEPRGPRVVLAGLCVVCGRTTTERGADGLPRHESAEAARLAVPEGITR